MAMSLPMILRRSLLLIFKSSRPANCMRLAVTFAVQGRSPITASIDTDLPEPDSPTMARTSRESTVSETLSTARNQPLPVLNSTVRFLMSRSAMAYAFSAFLEPGVERIAQTVAHEIDGEHRDEDSDAGQRHDPRVRSDEVARIGEHGAPFRCRRLSAEAQEAQACRFQYGVGDAESCLHDQRRQAVGQHGHEHQT